MIQVNYRSIIWCAVIVVITLFILFLFPWDCASITFSDVWKALGKTVTVSILLFTIFIKYLWRYKIFRFVIPIPYLGGEWDGILRYNWEGYDGEKPIKLTIRQSLFHIQLIIATDESISRSCSASFNIDEFRGEKQIIYSYSNQPFIKHRDHSPIHYGAALLNIADNNLKLEGHYWTDRRTTGELIFHKKNK